MSKIQHKIVKGKPLCTSCCSSYFSMIGEPDFCMISKQEVKNNCPCIPGLIEQRDRYRREQDEARKACKELEAENERLNVWEHVVMTLINKHEGAMVTEEFLQEVTASVAKKLNYQSLSEEEWQCH